MFFILSKVLSFLIQPLNWLLILLFLAVFSRTAIWRKRFTLYSLLTFLFFTNPVIINKLYKAWEWDAIQVSEVEEYDIAIVLGGFSSPTRFPRDRVHFQKGIDRFTNALELYHQGKVKKILLTGGSNRVVGEKVSEALVMEGFMDRIKFPEKDFITELNSKNTYENAVFTGELLDSLGLRDQSMLLITSAFHMTRAKGCFDRAGIKTTPFPTDYYSGQTTISLHSWLLPDILAFKKWNIILREWVGIMAYKVAGYI